MTVPITPIDYTKNQGVGFWVFRAPPNEPLVNFNSAGKIKYWVVEGAFAFIVYTLTMREFNRLFDQLFV